MQHIVYDLFVWLAKFLAVYIVVVVIIYAIVIRRRASGSTRTRKTTRKPLTGADLSAAAPPVRPTESESPPAAPPAPED